MREGEVPSKEMESGEAMAMLAAEMWQDVPEGARHTCPYSDGPPHTRGDGPSPVKRCRYCKAEMLTIPCRFGVFVWRGDGRYPLEEAVSVHSTARKAERAAERAAAGDPRAGRPGPLWGGYVVRWVATRADAR